MTLGQFAQLAEIVGVSVVVIGGVAAGGAWSWRALGRLRATFDRAALAIDRIDVMARELGDNGGASLKDAVMQTRGLVLLVNARQVALRHAIGVPLFEVDATGHLLSANFALERLTGYSAAELLGLGWVNVIDPGDRDRYMREWEQAIADRRAFVAGCRFLTRAGALVVVTVAAQPMIAGDDMTAAPVGWFGRVEVEGERAAA